LSLKWPLNLQKRTHSHPALGYFGLLSACNALSACA